jgi:hypothetical protein
MSHPLTFTVFIALLTTAILTILAGGQQSEIAGHAADETAIRAIVADRWMAGWNAHNVH